MPSTPARHHHLPPAPAGRKRSRRARHARRIGWVKPSRRSPSIGHDAIGRLTALADSLSGTLGWEYDAFDRVTREFGPQGSVAYTYDAVGRRQSMTAAAQAVTEYTWDNADRLRKILQGSEQVLFEYDDADRLTKTTLPNGVTQAYAYNAASQLTGIGWAKSDGTVLGNLGYGYSATLGRLTAQTGSFASILLPAASQGANAFDDNHRQTQYNGQNLTYDANGNLTGDGSRTYVWNSRDQLVQILQGGNAIASYSYDALGRRIGKTEGGITTNYLYDGLDAVQERHGSTLNPILTGLGIDERYARNDTNGRTYYLTDHLGSTRVLLDANGNVVNKYDYDPYGNVQQTGTGFSNPYQYTGREKDANGLMHYRARYYHPGMGRFIAEDPIGLAGGLNTYGYVGGNPLEFIDPDGLRGARPNPWNNFQRNNAGRYTKQEMLQKYRQTQLNSWGRPTERDLHEALQEFPSYEEVVDVLKCDQMGYSCRVKVKRCRCNNTDPMQSCPIPNAGPVMKAVMGSLGSDCHCWSEEKNVIQ